MGGYHSALHKLWCVIAEIHAVEKETRKEYGVGKYKRSCNEKYHLFFAFLRPTLASVVNSLPVAS